MLDDGYITGSAAKEATAQLQQNTSNLTINRDETTGKLSFTRIPKTKAEKRIANAINDKNISVNIDAENDEIF
jgi:hypothetical protein